MVDKVIMAAVRRDENAFGRTSTRYNYLVMTGQWVMKTGDDGNLHILSTDDFNSEKDADGLVPVLDATLCHDSEVVEGERLVMYTRVAVDGVVFSLVLLKNRIMMGEYE